MSTSAEARHPGAPILNLVGVSKRYRGTELGADGGVIALDQVTASASAGDVVALYGPSGSGKSTLLNVSAGLDIPDEGQVIVAGHDLASLTSAARETLRREAFGFVFQSFCLIATLTALENVALALHGLERDPRKRTARALEALDALGLADRAGHLPRQLSGGQQQRVAIARAIVREPSLVFADEPTANLDSKSAGAVLDQVQRLACDQAITFVIATHDARVRASASQVWAMDDGRLTSIHDGARP